MSYSISQKQKGLTMVELLVAMGIGTFLTLGIMSFASNTLRYQDEFDGRLNMLNDVRQVLRPMVAEMRQTQDSSVGGYALEATASDTVIFYSDIIDNDYRERVRYFLEEGNLKKGLTIPSGDPLEYDLLTESVVILMGNVTELAFRYYDESYSGAGGESELIEPFPTSDVRMIEVEISIDDDINREPNPLGQVSAFSQLRNLKDNL